jgi:hypothetical protein
MLKKTMETIEERKRKGEVADFNLNEKLKFESISSIHTNEH